MTAEQLPTRTIDQEIARNVKLAIFDAGMTQKEVGLAAGLHPASMTLSMQGKRPWRAEEILLVAQATGTLITDLLPRLDSNQQPAVYRPALVRALPVRHLTLVTAS